MSNANDLLSYSKNRRARVDATPSGGRDQRPQRKAPARRARPRGQEVAFQLFTTRLHHDAISMCASTRHMNMTEAVNYAIREVYGREIDYLLANDEAGKYGDDLIEKYGY